VFVVGDGCAMQRWQQDKHSKKDHPLGQPLCDLFLSISETSVMQKYYLDTKAGGKNPTSRHVSNACEPGMAVANEVID
jgi:hypothetical protein